jgi:homoserine kinase
VSRFNEALAFAPASVGNVAVGFDLLGHALVGAGDRVLARRVSQPGVSVLAITGSPMQLPLDVERNTAARAVQAMLRVHAPEMGVELEIEKGIPLGSGMGGSAASAVAGLVAANALLSQPLAFMDLYEYALEGEFAASGGRHGDNVAPSLLGGLILASSSGCIALAVPEGLTCLVVHPDLVVETRVARERLREPYPLSAFVAQSEALALFLCGLQRGDMRLLRAGLKDVLVEPRRADLIPGFAEVKKSMLDHGAIGASISGAGPSVFSWFESAVDAERALPDAVQGFAAAGLGATGYVSPVAAPGARVERCSA